MATSISAKITDFLHLLAKNNNREWFNEHKTLYTEALSDFQEFIEELMNEMGKFDKNILKADPKKSLFRIYRDTRFSKDKTPYKTNFGASFGMEKNGSKSGHYIHIEPGKSFLASGIYLPESPVLKSIRKEISLFKDEFLKTIESDDFKKHFGALDQEDKLKKVPQGFEKEDPMSEYLKLKSFIGIHRLSDTELSHPDAVRKFSKVFSAAKPLNDFLENAITNG
ncbi:DUF2461 domain-containing protein [Chryseobacterium taihuense]|uniref:TIGR02453 family protein n=1 Tax=Chryseobacterium taihuense TaxID=1141221 RepID=A0ABY0R2Y0_9FLAO|nr:DUF2461 domain-containing protein [Chryseobacterium taihuense]SDM34083.1 TIGR02453 family protein [Chryseobacterium taihuense]